jgi:hypothetical protein
MPTTTLHDDLRQFTGTDCYYRHWLKHVLYTDGVKFLINNGNCHWLLDAIASYLCIGYQKIARKYGEDFANFHAWTLTPKDAPSAVLEAKADTGRPVKIRQVIEYTDFPFDAGDPFSLWAGIQEVNGILYWVIMLPSEY